VPQALFIVSVLTREFTEMTKKLFKRGIVLYRRTGSAASLVLFSVTLLGLGVSIAGLTALSMGRPAAGGLVNFTPAGEQEAVAPQRALLSSEVIVNDPAVGVIWTMQVLPDDQEGREFTIKGTMEAPAGVQPGQEINMRLYYTETISENFLDEAMEGQILASTGSDEPMVVASRVEYMVSGAAGSEWGYQVDLVPASLKSRRIAPAGHLFDDGSAPCDSWVHL
jgi:hypothetical protein